MVPSIVGEFAMISSASGRSTYAWRRSQASGWQAALAAGILWSYDHVQGQWRRIPTPVHPGESQQPVIIPRDAGELAPTSPGLDRQTVHDGEVRQQSPIGEIRYRVHPSGRYGGHFRNRRPEGLPDTAAPVSEEGAAYPYARVIAERMGAPSDVVKSLLSLLENESSGEFARPANAYDDPRRRSWGPFQFLTSSWQGMSDPKDYWYPTERVLPEAFDHLALYQFGPYEQLYYPIRRYVLAAQHVRRLGGDGKAQARAIRIYHSGSRWLRRFLQGGRDNGFDWAAANMPTLAFDDEDEDWNDKMRGYDNDLRRWGVAV